MRREGEEDLGGVREDREGERAISSHCRHKMGVLVWWGVLVYAGWNAPFFFFFVAFLAEL